MTRGMVMQPGKQACNFCINMLHTLKGLLCTLKDSFQKCLHKHLHKCRYEASPYTSTHHTLTHKATHECTAITETGPLPLQNCPSLFCSLPHACMTPLLYSNTRLHEHAFTCAQERKNTNICMRACISTHTKF